MPPRVAVLLAVLSCALALPAVAAAAPPVNTAPPMIDDTTPVVGDVLTESGDTWDGTQTSVTYQWLRCDGTGTCTPIQGATATTYTVTTDDVGKRLQVRATAVNADGTTDQDSAPTEAVPPVPPENTALPTITGTAARDSQLTAQDGTWTGTPAPAVARQWQRCDSTGCTDIAGATGSTLLLGQDDVGRTIRVRETATNGGAPVTADSAQTAPVTGPPVNTALPTISGTASSRQQLTAQDGTWTGWPDPQVTRTWQRCDGATCTDIAGETGSTLVLGSADVGYTIRRHESATNDSGTETADSAPTALVTGSPENTAPPTITGTPSRGQQLTAHDGTWTGEPAPSVSRQWQRCTGTTCTDIAGATGSTLLLGAADVGRTIRLRETATNGGAPVTASSAPTAAVTGPPENSAPPTITGTAIAGRTLTAHAGSWQGFPKPTTSLRWLRCDASGANCVGLAGATGSTYVVRTNDRGHTIRLRETASNALGSANKDSAPTALVPIPVSNASPPLIEGTPVVGATLVSSIGDWNGTIPIVLTRRWQRCDASGCADIPGAVRDTYVVQAADLSKSIRLVVHGSNDGGGATAASALLGPVTAGSPPPPPPPPPAGASTAPGVTTLAAAFNTPRRGNLKRALAGKLKVRAECTGPCRLRVRIRASKAVARKWRVPRTLATGKRNLAAAGAATVRPKFAKKTRLRLRSVKKLAVVVVAEARDGTGKVVSSRRFKVTLKRPAPPS